MHSKKLAQRFQETLQNAAVNPPDATPAVPPDFSALFALLEAFSKEAPFLTFQKAQDFVELGYLSQILRFTFEKDIFVERTTEGPTFRHRIRHESRLKNPWVLEFQRHSSIELLPLFEKGLEELLVLGLGLPRPAPEESASMSPRLAEALLGKNDSVSETPFVKTENSLPGKPSTSPPKKRNL